MKVVPAALFRPVWNAPSPQLRLEGDDIHVWRASLEQPAHYVQCLWFYLSIEERERSEKIYLRKDRVCFIVARGLLRMILARYVDKDPRQLRFCYGAHGKPALSSDSGGGTLRFNLSHSCGLALFAITRDREIGVDVERVRHNFPYEEIAERFFLKREIAVLRALPKHVQPEAFFSCWTCKEAYVKARGEGLSLPLDSFTVSLAPDAPVTLPEMDDDPKEVSRWSLWAFAINSGYIASLAVEGSVRHFMFWQCESVADAQASTCYHQRGKGVSWIRRQRMVCPTNKGLSHSL